MGQDITVCPETHIKNGHILKAREPDRRFFSEAAPSTDRAAGTAILLSKRAARCVIGHSSVGSRINWVRILIAGPPLFVVATYIPHRGRTDPSREDTYADLSKLLGQVPRGDNLWLCLDANSRLQREKYPYVGKFAVHDRVDEGGEMLMEIMQQNDLW